MPSTDADPSPDREWTRRGVLAGGTTLLGALAGCSSLAGSRARDTDDPVAAGVSTTATAETAPKTESNTSGSVGREPLTIQTSWTVASAVHRAAGLWNANPSPTADRVPWERLGARPRFDERVADRFAERAGLKPTGRRADPPFRVATAFATGEPDRTAEVLLDETVDVVCIDALSRYHVADPDPERYFGDRTDAVAGRRFARVGYVFVVSPALVEAGVDALAPDQIRRVFTGDTTNWRTLGGPDREPFTFLGGDCSCDWLPVYEKFVRAGDAGIPDLDARFGLPESVVAITARRDDALGVLPENGVALARERGVPTLDVIIDGERRSIHDRGYPMTDDVHLNTLGEPDARERAFLDLLASPFGQRAIVGRRLIPADPPAGW